MERKDFLKNGVLGTAVFAAAGSLAAAFFLVFGNIFHKAEPCGSGVAST
jgi:hypothetical protein